MYIDESEADVLPQKIGRKKEDESTICESVWWKGSYFLSNTSKYDPIDNDLPEGYALHNPWSKDGKQKR